MPLPRALAPCKPQSVLVLVIEPSPVATLLTCKDPSAALVYMVTGTGGAPAGAAVDGSCARRLRRSVCTAPAAMPPSTTGRPRLSGREAASHAATQASRLRIMAVLHPPIMLVSPAGVAGASEAVVRPAEPERLRSLLVRELRGRSAAVWPVHACTALTGSALHAACCTSCAGAAVLSVLADRELPGESDGAMGRAVLRPEGAAVEVLAGRLAGVPAAAADAAAPGAAAVCGTCICELHIATGMHKS